LKRRRSDESLLSPSAMGAVLARKGMRFQDLWLLHNLAGWILDPLFRGFVNEGREDVDAFQFIDEKQSSYQIERWQLKDRLVTKRLLAKVLSGFQAQHQERLVLGQKSVWQFHLVAPAAQKDVWTLPDLIKRVRDARVAYGAHALEYLLSLDDLRRRLHKLGLRVEGSFVSERVSLDFRAGWAESNKHYWDTLEALLHAIGVAPDRASDAANHLFVIVSGDIGQLVERNAMVNTLRVFQGPGRVGGKSSAKSPGHVQVRPSEIAAPSPGRESNCLITYFPDEAVFLQFPDGTRGLIECGPTNARRFLIPNSESHFTDETTGCARPGLA
jgi:hypothetical protein